MLCGNKVDVKDLGYQERLSLGIIRAVLLVERSDLR